MNFTATPEAVDAIKTVMEKRSAEEGPRSVRVMVAHQCGCGSTKFQMGFDDREEGDSEIDLGGVTLLVDPYSAEALNEAKLEIVQSDNLMVPQFNITTPNAGGCGCGGGGHSH